jgi:AraC-like DNA-binding protein
VVKATFDRTVATAAVKLIHARRDRASGPEHEHDEAMIFVPLSGALRFEVAGATLVADAQHAIVVRAHTPHRHATPDPVEYFIAYVDDAALGDAAPAFRFPNTTLVRELAAELLAERRADAIAAATLLLCVQATRAGARVDPAAPLPDDDRLARAIDFARAHYRAGVATRDLARVAGMSPRALERALVRATGVTPRRLVEDLRLAEARDRLATGREAVSAVAFDLGYKSLSHFVRRFRAAFGVTPTGVSRTGHSTPRRGKPPPSRRGRLAR